ncbi:hypothetical protein [Streptomyces sp. NPDC047097]|uniref:hypothetical protein n=1 Tax=Streptomyces sp. NPDC047097 TaxID=3155260 RepID=UPI0033F263C5
MTLRRWARLLVCLVAALTVALSSSPAFAADPKDKDTGIIGDIADFACMSSGVGPLTDLFTDLDGDEMCEVVGKKVEEKVKQEFKDIWDSILGDVIKAAQDIATWVIKKVLTFALLGPSVDLEGTGLWSGDATLAGMLVWLGLVIATAGVMWQAGKMALTGKGQHLGRAAVGWVENLLLSTVGVSFFALLLVIGDQLTAGLVNATFDNDGLAYERILAVLIPAGVNNPFTVLCIVGVLLLIGFIQLVMIFLRQSAIPIICLLLPVAGAGRAGGDVTRQWAPKLITAGLVIVAYKPILAIIICIGFSEFGHATTLVEWLRGCVTLVLAVLAPGPLTSIFAPLGSAVGGGLAAGGASGALSAAASYIGGRAGADGADGASGGGGAPAAPATPMAHAQMVQQSMGGQNNSGGGGGGEAGKDGGDATAQAARNEAGKPAPNQPAGGPETPSGAPGAPGAPAAPGTPGVAGPAATGATTGTAAMGPGGAAVAGGIQVLDGVNNAIQGASNEIGNGGNQ